MLIFFAGYLSKYLIVGIFLRRFLSCRVDRRTLGALAAC